MSLKINLSLTLPDVDNPILSGETQTTATARRLENLMNQISMGVVPITSGGLSMDCRTSCTAASIGLTVASAGAGNYTVTIGGTSTGNVAFDTNDTGTAAAIAAAINANATLNKWVTATSALGAITVTCKIPGVIGNSLSIACTSPAGELTVNGGATRFASGAETRLVHSI